MNKKVFIVTAGEYSDYHTEAVFSTNELAEEYSKRAGDGYDIEEWELDAPMPEALIRVVMSKEGEVGYDGAYGTCRVIIGSCGFQWFKGKDCGELAGYIAWTVKTDDMIRAIKVVNEKRIQVLALNIWGDAKKVEAMIH